MEGDDGVSHAPLRGLARARRDSASASRPSAASERLSAASAAALGSTILRSSNRSRMNVSSGANSSRQARMSGSSTCQAARGATLVPTLGEGDTMPLAASVRIVSR
jgi:hypothetical protein